MCTVKGLLGGLTAAMVREKENKEPKEKKNKINTN